MILKLVQNVDDIINGTKSNCSNTLLNINHMKIFQFVTFCIKIEQVKSHYILDSIKYRFITSFDGKIKHLISFDYRLFNKVCDKIKHLLSKKSGITYSINHSLGRIRIDLYLPNKKDTDFS